MNFETRQLIWKVKMFVKTQDIFYLKIIMAQFKDIRRNYELV